MINVTDELLKVDYDRDEHTHYVISTIKPKVAAYPHELTSQVPLYELLKDVGFTPYDLDEFTAAVKAAKEGMREFDRLVVHKGAQIQWDKKIPRIEGISISEYLDRIRVHQRDQNHLMPSTTQSV